MYNLDSPHLRAQQGRRGRYFLGIFPPPEVRRAIGNEAARLKHKYPKITLVPEKQLHITLFFLGSQKQTDVARLIEEAKRELNLAKLDLQLGGINYLYKRRGDSVVYLNIEEGGDNLKELVKRWRPIVEKIDYTAPRRWLGHLTLARVKKLGPDETRRVLFDLGKEEVKKITPFEVKAVSLVENQQMRSGADYRLVDEVSLI